MTRQAIQTEWRGPTNTNGARIIAKCEAWRVVVPWDHSLGIEDNHRAAAETLRDNLGWEGELIGGGLPGSDYAWVFAE